MQDPRIQDLEALRRRFAILVPDLVRWGDMDAFQHANNTVFLRFFEAARVDFLGRMGFFPHAPSSQIGPILADTFCRFRAPLKYPDRVQTGVEVVDIEKDRFVLLYVIFSETLHRVAAEGKSLIVSYDYSTQSKCNLPSDVSKTLRQFAAAHPAADR